MLNNIKAVIFDLDGTLIDSLWIWDKIDIDYLSSKNIPVPEDLNEKIGHLSFHQTAEYFKNTFNIDDSLDIIKQTWNNMAHEHYLNDVPLKNGVINFLEFLKNKNIKIGLATSNSTYLLEAALKGTGIYDYFDAITITDEVGKGKHNPDVYLLAASKLGVSPENCLVFEDILPAIKGAKSAGMKVIGIEDAASSKDMDNIIKESDMYIKDYTYFMDNLLVTK